MEEKLIDKIKTLKHNSDYRVADILFKKGERWEHSANMVLVNEKYNDTILQTYLKLNSISKNYNLRMLLDIIEIYNKNNNLPIPEENEVVLHLRMGDVVVKSSFLSKDYINLLNNLVNKNPNINKITIVTCFAYGEWSAESLHLRKKAPLWNYTEKKQQENISKLKTLIQKINNNFPKINLDIMSNYEIDKDICYCVLSKNFIMDIGGFSDLLNKLNCLKNS